MKGPHCTHRRNTQLQSAVISCGSAVEEAAACQSQTHTHKVVDNGWEKTFEWENALVLALPLRANLDSERERVGPRSFFGGVCATSAISSSWDFLTNRPSVVGTGRKGRGTLFISYPVSVSLGRVASKSPFLPQLYTGEREEPSLSGRAHCTTGHALGCSNLFADGENCSSSFKPILFARPAERPALC